MNPDRLEKIRAVAQKRQNNLGLLLENITDLHNIGAALRTADSVGVKEVFILYTGDDNNPKKVKLGKKTSAGARKWLEVYLFNDVEACVAAIRSKYDKIYSTHLDANSKSLYDLELSESVVLAFGNEKRGISEPLLAACDGNFIIPQMGMAQSLNISVACAISLYEAFRQRNEKAMYTENLPQSEAEQNELLAAYVERSETIDRRHIVHVEV
jgi:tRNA (guanosine-2'-O-)-methyltransferase